MKDKTPKRLYDCFEFGQKIIDRTSQSTLEDYLSNEDLRLIVERCLIVIGEAFTSLRDDDTQTYDKFEEGHMIIGLRNRMIHGYETIDDDVVFKICKEDVPLLVEKIKKLLNL